MSLHKLIFDTTDADTIADSHSVGAYLRASDGTLLTHTDVGGKKALDVRVAEGINVEVDLDFADDSVDVSGSTVELGATTLAALETITVLQGTSPWVVSATDLDIRNLVFATDKVDVSGSTITATVSDAALANTALLATAAVLTAANTEEDILASALANRKYLWLYNNDNRVLYVGGTGVDGTDGFPVPPGSMLDMRAGPAVAIQWVSEKTSHNMRVLELS